jgi:progressive ankylosis protein
MKFFFSKTLKNLSKNSIQKDKVGLVNLWREFLPLSLSDVTMACGDPLITTTLAHLPAARSNLAAIGIAKALAIFFESPIIMILHASNALAPQQASRVALWRFVLLAGGGLSLLLGIVALPDVFSLLGSKFLGVPTELSHLVRQVLFIMCLWPFAIAWRRYFQGLLIYHGNSHAVAVAGILRLVSVAIVLAVGFTIQMSGVLLAGFALIVGVIVEAIAVTIAAYRCGATLLLPQSKDLPKLPHNLAQVWRFYCPLANSMLVVWGGRAILVGILARAQDASIALAAWPAAWGLVLVIANSTRMVQQIVIKYRNTVSDRLLMVFALSVGLFCSFLLLLTITTNVGDRIIEGFIGSDRELVNNIKPILLLCAGVPLLVALQNATQGFLVGEGRTGGVNQSTWIGTSALLSIAFVTVQLNINGGLAAAIAMVSSIAVEVGCLIMKRRSIVVSK